MEERTGSSDSEPVRRPYARMALLGLQAGLTWRDMRRMKYTHLLQLLYEWDDMHGGAESDDEEPEPSNDAAGLLGL